ncbi:hypothetical protein GGQ84_001108 [Desulfitispora alkaliphila]|uniref:DUF3189 family protein n=1 Tax=Desulfitispora alkaliphila TaxID=622674 RepID=UPI003D21C1BD
MEIIYHCFGGAHSSVTAAAIHLGMLPEESVPTSKQLIDTPFYDKQENDDHGTIKHIGTDNMGNEVYIVGRRGLDSDFETFLEDFMKLNKVQANLIIVGTLSGVNIYMRLGGYLSRKLRLTWIGRPLVLYGTKKAHMDFVKIVHQTKKQLEQEN